MSYSPTAGANGNNNNSKSNNSAGAGETAAAAEARLRMTVSAANSPAGTAFLTSTQPLPTSSRQTMAAATAGNRHQGDDPLLEHDWYYG
jgi:hypothetical protein